MASNMAADESDLCGYFVNQNCVKLFGEMILFLHRLYGNKIILIFGMHFMGN